MILNYIPVLKIGDGWWWQTAVVMIVDFLDFPWNRGDFCSWMLKSTSFGGCFGRSKTEDSWNSIMFEPQSSFWWGEKTTVKKMFRTYSGTLRKVLSKTTLSKPPISCCSFCWKRETLHYFWLRIFSSLFSGNLYSSWLTVSDTTFRHFSYSEKWNHKRSMNFTKEKFKKKKMQEVSCCCFFLLIRGGFLSKRRKNVGMPRKTIFVYSRDSLDKSLNRILQYSFFILHVQNNKLPFSNLFQNNNFFGLSTPNLQSVTTHSGIFHALTTEIRKRNVKFTEKKISGSDQQLIFLLGWGFLFLQKCAFL